jgi:hypothetical protein
MQFVIVCQASLTPSTRLILRHLVENPQPQRYMEIAAATQTGYWHTRRICLGLVKDGHLLMTHDSRFPLFSIRPATTTEVL